MTRYRVLLFSALLLSTQWTLAETQFSCGAKVQNTLFESLFNNIVTQANEQAAAGVVGLVDDPNPSLETFREGYQTHCLARKDVETNGRIESQMILANQCLAEIPEAEALIKGGSSDTSINGTSAVATRAINGFREQIANIEENARRCSTIFEQSVVNCETFIKNFTGSGGTQGVGIGLTPAAAESLKTQVVGSMAGFTGSWCQIISEQQELRRLQVKLFQMASETAEILQKTKSDADTPVKDQDS